MNEKERLYNAFCHNSIDRQPCICPGGMMNMITKELMDKCGVKWPDAHLDAEKMADLAQASYEYGCFENVGVPFCMTIEAEGFGAKVTMGNDTYEPHVTEYAISNIDEWEKISGKAVDEGRAKVVIEAIRKLKERNLSVPIIGNITGPISTASSVMDPNAFYKALRKNKEASHAYLKYITEEIIKFANAQIEAGADVIAISDPSGTGEILGPKFFEEYAVRYINMLLDGLNTEKLGTIVHICGDMKNVYKQIDMVRADALSFDSVVPMADARRNLGNRVLMGNVSTYALEFGSEDDVERLTKKCAENADIISPACGLGTRSPIKNIQVMLKTLKNEEVSTDA